MTEHKMANEVMKALMITRVGERAELCEVPRVEAEDGGVLVKVHFSGVSVGTEMWVASGRRDPQPAPFLNAGYQATGEIVQVGAKVTDFAVGDVVAVFCGHAHAQYVQAKSSLVHKLPDASAMETAALFVMPSVGSHALSHADVRGGDTVLVVGQGLIGQCTAQLARLRGAYVIASEVSPQRLAISQQYCADWVIDASKCKLPEEVTKRFPGGVDVVLESTGFQELVEDAMACVRGGGLEQGGKFVFEGWYPDKIAYTYHLPHTKQLRAFFPSFIGERPNREGVLRLIARGKLDIEPLISHHVPWQQAGEVYSKLFTDQRNSFNGIVFDWREG